MKKLAHGVCAYSHNEKILGNNTMQIYSLLQRHVTTKALNLVCGALTGYAVYVNFYRIELLQMIIYKAVVGNLLAPIQILTFFIFPAILSMFFIEKFYYIKCGKNSNSAEYCRIMLPLLGMAIFLIIPVNFWCPLIFIFIVGIVAFRYAAAYFSAMPEDYHPQAETSRNLRICLSIFLLGMIASGFYMQYVGLNVLYLLYYDWGVYAGVADNVLRGNGFVLYKGGMSFLGSHFSPASILMLVPYIWVFYSKYAIFLLNSLLLYSCVPLIYCLARNKKIPEFQALLLAGCVIFSPSLANMNLTLFYGFHDIYFFMPMLIIFFIFYEKGKYVAAFSVFALTLLIKETVPVFWVGMGIAFVLYGRRKAGFWMILVGVIYWLTVVKLVIPWISGQTVYDYADRFKYLGTSFWGIALSPVFNPSLFWGHLFRPQCVFFGILLFIPLFLFCLNRSVLLTGGIISFVFICLQSSDQLQNISMQYQAEILTLIFINCVFVLEKFNHSEERNLPFIKLLATPATPNCRSVLTNAMLSGTVITSLLSFYFFGQSVISKNSFLLIMNEKNWSNEIAQIKTLVPENVPINATMNIAGHFLLRNEVYPQLTPVQDYVLIDLNADIESQKEIDQLRKKILADGYKVIFNKEAQEKHIVLFAKTVSQSQSLPDSIFTLKNESEWDLCGTTVAISNHDFKLKGSIQGRVLRLYIRPAKSLKYDATIAIKLGDIFFNNHFGNGVTPAFNVGTNQVFIMTVQLPDTLDMRNKFKIEIIPRSVID